MPVRATNEDNRLVAATLQVAQHHDSAKVADVKRVGRGVGAQVSGHHPLLQGFFGAGDDLSQHTAPFQLFNKVFNHRIVSL